MNRLPNLREFIKSQEIEKKIVPKLNKIYKHLRQIL